MEQVQKEIAELNNNISNLDYATLMYMSLNVKNLGTKALMEKKDERTAYIQFMHFVTIFTELQTHEGYIENKGFYETLISPNSVIKIMRCCEKLYERIWINAEVEKLNAADKDKLNMEINKQFDNYNRARSNTIKQFLKEVKSTKPQPHVSQPLGPLQPSKRYNPNVLHAPKRKQRPAPIFLSEPHLPTCKLVNPKNQSTSRDVVSSGSSVKVRTDADHNKKRQNENLASQAQQQVPPKQVRFSGNNDNQQNNNLAHATHQPINFPRNSTPRNTQSDADSSVMSHGFMNYAFIAEGSQDALLRQVQRNPTNQIRSETTNLRKGVPGIKITNEDVQRDANICPPPPQVPKFTEWPKVYNGNYMKNN